MDRILAEMVIGKALNKKFRKSDFRIIPYKKLRNFGLISLVHRNRLFRHGKLKVSFLSLHNNLVYERYSDMIDKRQNRINHVRLSKKIRQEGSIPVSNIK